jgi:RimJ/RimL family protein N-acetyltransferase
MTRPFPIEGPRLRLRPVVPDDAAYIYALRTDPRYNTHLSPVAGGVEQQRKWIERYLDREAQGREIYFVIERRSDAQRCGVVRLYDITEQQFTWGSWILDENKPSKAALESAVLSFGYGFDVRVVEKAAIDVRRDNGRALNFYRRFGMKETYADDINIYFEYPREQFFADLPRFQRLLRINPTS